MTEAKQAPGRASHPVQLSTTSLPDMNTEQIDPLTRKPVKKTIEIEPSTSAVAAK